MFERGIPGATQLPAGTWGPRGRGSPGVCHVRLRNRAVALPQPLGPGWKLSVSLSLLSALAPSGLGEPGCFIWRSSPGFGATGRRPSSPGAACWQARCAIRWSAATCCSASLWHALWLVIVEVGNIPPASMGAAPPLSGSAEYLPLGGRQALGQWLVRPWLPSSAALQFFFVLLGLKVLVEFLFRLVGIEGDGRSCNLSRQSCSSRC